MALLYKHFVQGIADQGPAHFGGQTCFQEIPPIYHYSVSIISSLIIIYCIKRWSSNLIDHNVKIQKIKINLFERLMFWIGLLCFVYTAYYKIITKRGLFLLNPCHISLLGLLYILNAKDNNSQWMRKIHALWTGWWIGGLAGFLFPHLQDLTNFQIVLFFIEHGINWPIGPLITYRRYGLLKPSLKVGFISFGTFILHQLLILVPIGRFFKVNINFALCHSPQEPFFDQFGYHYFTIQMFQLTLIAIFLQYFTYGYVTILKKLYSSLKNTILLIVKYLKNVK